jgi:hypothetical protein
MTADLVGLPNVGKNSLTNVPKRAKVRLSLFVFFLRVVTESCERRAVAAQAVAYVGAVTVVRMYRMCSTGEI